MNAVVTQIHKMDDADELKSIKDAAQDRIEILASRNFRVGSKVQMRTEYQHRNPYDAVGKVTKVNQKTFKVKFGNTTWTVSKGMIQNAD